MKIKAILKLEFYNNNFYRSLVLKVKFKLPNKKFWKSTNTTLNHSAWTEYQYELDSSIFYKDCLQIIKDRDRIIKYGEEAIKEYMRKCKNITEKTLSKSEMSALINNFNSDKIEVEYEINDKKIK